MKNGQMENRVMDGGWRDRWQMNGERMEEDG